MDRRTRIIAVVLSLFGPMAGCPSTEVAPEPDPRPAPMSNLTPEQARIYEEYKALALKNDCSGGFRGLSGRWRFVGKSRTPDYAAELTVDGTRFSEELRGKPDGRALTARLEGEIRCLFKNRVLMTVDRVKPEGAFDNRSGEAYPCDLLSDMDPNHVRMLMICYFDWDLRPAAGREFEYERID
jgi:hypothetical protein